MTHPFNDKARQSARSAVSDMTGKRGEYPPDRAERIAGTKVDAAKQGQGKQQPEECWNGAPARQISNFGNVRK